MSRYRLITTPRFEKCLKHLDAVVLLRIRERLIWLADHPEAIGSPMSYLPREFRGLHKFRVGDYRVLFWVDHQKETITLYLVDHRRAVYQIFRST